MAAPAYVVQHTGALTAPNARNGPAVGRENVRFMPTGIYNKFEVLKAEDVDGEHEDVDVDEELMDEEDAEQHAGAVVQPPQRRRGRRQQGRGRAAAGGHGWGFRRPFLIFVSVAGAIATLLSLFLAVHWYYSSPAHGSTARTR